MKKSTLIIKCKKHELLLSPLTYPKLMPTAMERLFGGLVMAQPCQFLTPHLGQILAGPNFNDPCILIADLDLDEIPRSKYDFDVGGKMMQVNRSKRWKIG